MYPKLILKTAKLPRFQTFFDGTNLLSVFHWASIDFEASMALVLFKTAGIPNKRITVFYAPPTSSNVRACVQESAGVVCSYELLLL